MSIRHNLQWNFTHSKYSGLIDIGRKYIADDTIPIAKDALVYNVSGVEEDFKLPVAYFCTNGLDDFK